MLNSDNVLVLVLMYQIKGSITRYYSIFEGAKFYFLFLFTILLDLKTLDKIMGFSVHLHFFITCSDTNYLHTQIKKNPEKLIAIVNAKVFIYGALKLLSRN